MIDGEVSLGLFFLSHGLLQADELLSIGGADGNSGVLFGEERCLILDAGQQDGVLFKILDLMHHYIWHQDVYSFVGLQPRPRKMSLLGLVQLKGINLLFKLRTDLLIIVVVLLYLFLLLLSAVEAPIKQYPLRLYQAYQPVDRLIVCTIVELGVEYLSRNP